MAGQHSDDLTYDRMLLSDLTSLRFGEPGHGVLILGPVRVGKAHLATALGHIGIRRRLSVHASRTDKFFTRLRAARLDNTLEAEVRKLARVDLLILDDFALRNLDATDTNDFYELVVERHRKTATIVTSNREPSEWMSMMSDALLAQSAIDGLTSRAHTLIIDGPSYRQRDRLNQRAVVGTEVLEPKSAKSRRTIPLSDPAADVLVRVGEPTEVEQVQAAQLWEHSGHVFVTDIGEPCDPRNALRALTVAARRAGLEGVGLHTLRHSAASVMLSERVPLNVVSQILGHSGIAITADVYGHIAPDVSRSALDVLGTALTAFPTTSPGPASRSHKDADKDASKMRGRISND